MHKVVKTKMKRCKIGSFANLEMRRYTTKSPVIHSFKDALYTVLQNQGKHTAKKRVGWGLTALYNLRLTILYKYEHIFQFTPGKITDSNQKELKVNFIEKKTLLKYSILVSVVRLHILYRLFGSLFVIYLLVLILAPCFLLLVLVKILIALHLIYYPNSDSLLDNQ